jgi:hypothetical protein
MPSLVNLMILLITGMHMLFTPLLHRGGRAFEQQSAEVLAVSEALLIGISHLYLLELGTFFSFVWDLGPGGRGLLDPPKSPKEIGTKT